MIDPAGLREMRGRCEAARGAMVAVRMHTAHGIFGPLPTDEAVAQLPAAVASVKDVPVLIAEVERLSPASYLRGPQGCCEGACEEEEPLPPGQWWCSHVTETVATFDDVIKAECLERLVEAITEAAQRLDRGEDPDPSGSGRDLTTLIREGVANTRERIALWEQTGEEG